MAVSGNIGQYRAEARIGESDGYEEIGQAIDGIAYMFRVANRQKKQQNTVDQLSKR